MFPLKIASLRLLFGDKMSRINCLSLPFKCTVCVPEVDVLVKLNFENINQTKACYLFTADCCGQVVYTHLPACYGLYLCFVTVVVVVTIILDHVV